ncbi:IbrB-like domain-containing protein [Anaerostipes caccae]|uniref:IbrB-like domain-containing protein n=1 Tax=Anaerostipes caccae TaxID=105841 RepID=UPI00241C290D|nr:ParB/RepB/Spo0J family partition protein [Anaerostipes caccae]
MTVEELEKELVDCISSIDDIEEKVDTLNRLRRSLSSVSPFNQEPTDCVLWIKQDMIQANEYNPNKVASPEMKLLYKSIKEDGYTMPIVTYYLGKKHWEIVDGFHRNRIDREYKDIKERTKGYLPITILDKPEDERIGSTIRHNRARGTHGIRPMSDIVMELVRSGWDDEKICDKLGMDLDEVIRLKQITGLKEAFMDHDFSKSWEEFEQKIEKEID